MSTYSTYSPRLHKHGSHDLHHTFHSEIPFFEEDIGPISFRDWIWVIEAVPHQIKTDKMQYMKVNQVVS